MKIVLASSNLGKLNEIQQVLAPLNLTLIPQSEFIQEEVEETGLSFIENAIIKARHAAKMSGLPALADDSGLAVDALNGAPGIYSSRYSGLDANDAKNNEKLLRELEKIPDSPRTAQFHCALVYMRHAQDPSPLIAQGVWEGEILPQARGSNGFGYDPLFFCPKLKLTSAELLPETKNKVSHRAKALTLLVKQLQNAANV